ncbi:uncharacterized protein RJT20DRAFT_124282 [Scheffersomyces xylosifermentans]|uniref:uncharacterized protein n=1 Tax=Scheffersomyces xylosifermentans TaxID=1304137 RepID=UPI00315D1684
MKLSAILIGASLLSMAKCQFFPLNRKEEIPVNLVPYKLGQEVYIDCITRSIDNGEHKFDEQERIIYAPFPICKETNKPLSFQYGVSEDFNCTLSISDELYHLFQLYIHEDAPFSCRLPLSSEANYLEKGGAYVPLTFNFRGEIHDSHLDIDTALNVLLTKPANSNPEENTFISSIAYSSGTNTTRIVIGDSMTLSLAVRWLDQIVPTGSQAGHIKNNGLPFSDGFYRFPMNFVPISYSWFIAYLAIVSLATAVLVYAFSYKHITHSASKHKYKPLDSETAVGKED